MPILPAAPMTFPGDLFARLGETPGVWWVLHTQPRCEKATARLLQAEGLPYFLPLCPRIIKKGKRRPPSETSWLPLFPGYMFLRGDDDSRLLALRTNKILQTLKAPDESRLASELHDLYELLSTGKPVEPEPKLVIGMRVEVVSGPLRGMHGRVIQRRGKLRFVVQVEFLGQGASLEVEANDVEPLE